MVFAVKFFIEGVIPDIPGPIKLARKRVSWTRKPMTHVASKSQFFWVFLLLYYPGKSPLKASFQIDPAFDYIQYFPFEYMVIVNNINKL